MNAFLEHELQAVSSWEEGIAPPATTMLDIIFNQRFGVEYQPVAETQSGEIAGYEALARFYLPDLQQILPSRMFTRLHDNPMLLFHVEMEMKKLQIAMRPAGLQLFLNLDPDSYVQGGIAADNPFISLFREHAYSDAELVIEVIENLNTRDAVQSQQMIDTLLSHGMRVALDDIGATYGLLSLNAFVDATVIKFDWNRLAQRRQPSGRSTLEWLIGMARELGIQTVLEGVETCDDLSEARRLQVDYVQGYLFSKHFVRTRAF